MKHSVVLAVLILVAAVSAVAHDGHEPVVVLGTIQAVNADRIQIETRDDASLQLKRVWVITTAKTIYKRGKERVDAETAQPTAGERAVAVVNHEHLEDASERFVAIQIELRARKK